MRFAPGVSFKVNEMISVGITANIMYATMEFNAGGPTQTPHMGAASYGYGATIGLSIHPVDKVTLGLAYETISKFQDFEFNEATNDGEDKLEFNQPQNATIGIGLEPVKGLLIGFDVQWIKWTDSNGEKKPEYTTNSSGAQPWNMDWEDQYVYKVGIQYLVIPMLTVRAGYNYGKMPLNKDRAFENIAFPAIAEQHYTAGFGINVNEKFSVNIGGMYSPEASIMGENTSQGISSYETKMSQYSLDMGIAYTF